jgi:hypothetical protein
MKYATEMGSGAMIHIPSFMKIGSGIQRLLCLLCTLFSVEVFERALSLALGLGHVLLRPY